MAIVEAADWNKISKMIAHFRPELEGEAGAAFSKACASLSACGLNWCDVASRVKTPELPSSATDLVRKLQAKVEAAEKRAQAAEAMAAGLRADLRVAQWELVAEQQKSAVLEQERDDAIARANAVPQRKPRKVTAKQWDSLDGLRHGRKLHSSMKKAFYARGWIDDDGKLTAAGRAEAMKPRPIAKPRGETAKEARARADAERKARQEAEATLAEVRKTVQETPRMDVADAVSDVLEVFYRKRDGSRTAMGQRPVDRFWAHA